MGCDWYTEDDGGEFAVTVVVESEQGRKVRGLDVDVPPNASIYVYENESSDRNIHER